MRSSVTQQNLSKVAIKNTSFSLISVLFLKFGGLIFTIIIARALLPELFGIYSLAISITTLVYTFTNLGIDQTFIRYFSEELGKNNKNRARSYFKYFLKLKVTLIFFTIFILILFSKYLAYDFYEIPLLYHALLFSYLFLFFESIKNFIGAIYFGKKYLKPLPIFELIHQVLKITLAILAILLLRDSLRVPGLFLALSLAGFIHFLILLLIMFKKDKEIFIGRKVPIQRRRVWKYLAPMSIASISLIFFGSIDILMLAKFVDPEYIGYYRATLGLVLTMASLFTISNVLLPIFTQIKKKRFERGFQKTIKSVLIFTIPASVGIMFVAKYLILLIYGSAYSPAISLLYFFAILVIIGPLITIYTTIFESKEKPKIVAIAISISLLVNIILNYTFIKYSLDLGPTYVMSGVALSTVISRILLFGILYFNAKRIFNLSIKLKGLRMPILATSIMTFFLLVFNEIFYINSILVLVEVILGAGIYFLVLILTKGITKDNISLLKNLYKR